VLLLLEVVLLVVLELGEERVVLLLLLDGEAVTLEEEDLREADEEIKGVELFEMIFCEVLVSVKADLLLL
jgi:hypothetical protein